MIFNNREITPDLFKLADKRFNRLGLIFYMKSLEKSLGVKYHYYDDIERDGKKIKTVDWLSSMDCRGCGHPFSGVVISPELIAVGLTENQYRAAKGIIDHETGHVFWFDTSYDLIDLEDSKREVIYLIAAIIDDIRVEQRMIKEFGVDGNNFRLVFETNPFSYDESSYDALPPDSAWWFFILTRKMYYDIDISFLGDRKIPDPFLLAESRFRTIIDGLIASDDGKAVDAAREITRLFDDRIVKIISKTQGKAFKVKIDGKPAWLTFRSEFQFDFKEGDEIPMYKIAASLGIGELMVSSNKKYYKPF